MIPGNYYAARTQTYEHRSLLFVSSSSYLDERTGETGERVSLASLLLDYRKSGIDTPVICTNDAASIIKELDDTLGNHPYWTWRATPLRRVKRGAAKSPESKPAISVRLQVSHCGFKRTNGHGRNTYFWFVDCVSITGRTSSNIYPDCSEEESLHTFGTRYRDFCRENGTKMFGARGSFGSAMLRDPRFIGSGERRLPSFINDEARRRLPGNHYELRTDPAVRLESATYLDISGAHHVAAERTKFPDPSGIRARGFHREPPTSFQGQEPWTRVGSRKFDRILRTHGLVLLRAQFAGKSKNALFHPAAERASTNRPNFIWAYTNELDLLRSSGFDITGVEVAYTAGRTSESLNLYARYARETLKNSRPEDKSWKKSLLLSTYGMLAKRPSQYQSVSNMAGRSFDWPTGSGWLPGQILTTQKEHSPATTNVIALGMIQAEVRRNVIETARYLQSLGVTVLALYADSLVVEGDTVPFLPPEWRIAKALTNVVFIDPVSWVADQDERLPGRTGPNRYPRARAIAQAEPSVKGRDTLIPVSVRFGTGPSHTGKDRVFRAKMS